MDNGDKVKKCKTKEEYVKDGEKGRKIFWKGVIVVYTAPYLLSFFVPPVAVSETIYLHWWLIVLFFQTIYTIASFNEQQQNEVGAVLFFGRVLYETKPGLVFTPLLFCSLLRETSLVQSWETPTDLPFLYKSDENGKLVRFHQMLTTSAPLTNKKEKKSTIEEDPLQTGRLILGVKILIIARLSKDCGSFTKFIENIGSMESFLRIADDLTVNAFRKEVAKNTPSEIYSKWSDIEESVKSVLKERFGEFGFAELSVKVKEFDLPQTINDALTNRTISSVAVETERLKGEGIMERDFLVAKAVKALEAAPIEGRVQALKEAISQKGLNITPEQAVFMAYQEVIKSALKDANYSLLPQGKGGMLDPASMMSIMQEAIKTSQKNSKKEIE